MLFEHSLLLNHTIVQSELTAIHVRSRDFTSNFMCADCYQQRISEFGLQSTLRFKCLSHLFQTHVHVALKNAAQPINERNVRLESDTS